LKSHKTETRTAVAIALNMHV